MKLYRLKRIYIMPTRFGFVFIAGAILMILIGASYQNNLVNLLSYFMLSLIFISMIQTHNNLKDIRIEAVESDGGFEGAEFVLTTIVANDSKVARFGIETAFKDLKVQSVYENFLPLIPGSSLKLRSSFVGQRRGRHCLTEVKISSSYPLGLFRAWLWAPIEHNYFVYPKPEGEREIPVADLADETGQNLASNRGDDFYGHRKFAAGDSARHVDWKAHARGRRWQVKEFGGAAPAAYSLDWNRLEGLPLEVRLSQLSQWVETARKSKLPFALRLPDRSLPSAQGIQHARACLELLAAYEEAPQKAGPKRGPR